MPYLTTTNGCRLWYETQGSGTPIIFVHEFGGDHRSWNGQLEALAGEFHCVTYSARGFFPSDIPASVDAYGQEFSTGDLYCLIDQLGIDDAHIVGTSMGSFTSLDFALKHSEKVRSLTLVGNSSGPRNNSEREHYRNNWVLPEIERRSDGGGKGAVAVLREDAAYQTLQREHPTKWRTYSENLSEQSVEGAINILRTVHWNRESLWDQESNLQSLNVPVLLVYGDEDYYLVGETNEYLQRVLPQSKLELFLSTGHLVNIEKTNAFNQLLVEHILAAEV